MILVKEKKIFIKEDLINLCGHPSKPCGIIKHFIYIILFGLAASYNYKEIIIFKSSEKLNDLPRITQLLLRSWG